MKRIAMLIVCFPLLFAGVPMEPTEVVLTPSEERMIQLGEIVVRNVPSDSGGFVMGIVDIPAPPSQVWNAIFDFEARVAEIRSLSEVDVYQRTTKPEQLGVKWVLSVLGQGIVFHITYTVDRQRGWCRYSLDTTKPNDIVSSEGAYQVSAQGSSTRFIYRSQSDSGRRVPGWLRRWFAVDSLKEQISGIKRRSIQSR